MARAVHSGVAPRPLGQPLPVPHSRHTASGELRYLVPGRRRRRRRGGAGGRHWELERRPLSDRRRRCINALNQPEVQVPILSATRSTRSRGFTLLELMVVIVLVGILSAMIIPEMKGSYGDALLRATGRDLVSVFGLA